MTFHKQSVQFVSVMALLSTIISVNGHAALPDNSYACHVETRGSGPGLVTVQAHSLESAKKIALRAEALNMYGTYTPVKRLVQCVEKPKGRFSDTEFQEFYQNLPR